MLKDLVDIYRAIHAALLAISFRGAYIQNIARWEKQFSYFFGDKFCGDFFCLINDMEQEQMFS